MRDDLEQLDEDLAQLARSLRSRDLMISCIQLAEFALKLERRMRREERALSFADERVSPTTASLLLKVKNEHASLRRLIGLVASALDRADDHRGLEAIGKLRSVLMLHVAKEGTLWS